jgi:glutamate decarboxylase
VPLHRHSPQSGPGERLDIRPQFTLGDEPTELPRHRIGEGELAPRTAFQIVHDELMLEATPG